MTTRRQFLNLAAAALATPALPRLRRAQNWPTTADPRHDPVLGRQHASTSSGASCSIRCRASSASRSWSRTAAAPAASSAPPQVAKAEPDGYTILINASAHSAAPAAYPNIAYDPARDFSAVIPFGTIPNVTVVAPAKGIKTLKELVAAAKAGSMTLRLRRRRQRHPLGGRAAARQRRLQGRACAVPRRAGGAHRGDDRARRFHLHGHVGRASVHPRRQARAARREHAEALVGAAGRADHAGGGLCQLRLQFLDGHARAGEDAARDRRPAAAGDPEGAARIPAWRRSSRRRASSRCR